MVFIVCCNNLLPIRDVLNVANAADCFVNSL